MSANARWRTRDLDEVVGRNNTLAVGSSVAVDSLSVRGSGHDNTLSLGDGVVLRNATVRFRGSGSCVSFGSRVRFAGAISVSGGASVHVGPRSTFGRADIVAHEASVTIGADCMFAHHVEIRTTDTHSIFDLDTGERINGERPVRIGDYVWVGKRVTILKGVSVGDGAVVALGSVVTGDVAERAVVAGNPASERRRGVVWTRYEGSGRWQDDETAASYNRGHLV